MWGSGVAKRRQQTAVNEMVAAASRSGSYTEPWRSTPGVWEHFRDEAEILRHLQRTWRNTLAGAVYVAIEQGEGDLPGDVTRAFETTCRRHSGIRKILEAHRDHPAIASAMRKEGSLLSCLVAGLDAEGARVGDLTAV
jgi:hypothetical protein